MLAPIGFRYSGWRRDPAGHALWGIGLYTTPRSWARLGVLLRDDGRFRGREVLPPGLLAQCLRGSAAMPAYGLTVWLNEAVPGPVWHNVPGVLVGPFARTGRVLWPEGPADLFAAVGYQDNRLYVVPSRRLVIVRFGAGDTRFQDAQLLSRMLESGP